MALLLEILSLFLITGLISWPAACDAQNTTAFLDCVSKHPEGVLGNLYTPDSPAYLKYLKAASQNRRWFNVSSQRPYLIASPGGMEEIRPLILCSKELGFQVRAKSGGHDYEGLSFRSETSFIMVDLVQLSSVTIDVKEEAAWIETGATLGQLYYEIANKSSTLAFPGGLYSTVGSGGHISGGGLGTLLRKYGLASDNVLDARIMDVNGTILDRKSMGKDLFWAIRGGGGASFGVILAWKLKLVRVPEQVTAFTIRQKLAPENLDLLQKWQNNAYKLPEALFIRVLMFPDTVEGQETLIKTNYQGLFLGPAEELVQLLKHTFPEFGLETKDCSGISSEDKCVDRPCPRVNCSQVPWIRSVLFFMGLNPISVSLEELLVRKDFGTGFQKATSDFLDAPIPNEGFMMLRDMILSESMVRPMVIMDPFGGKMDEIGEHETPFPHRKGNLFSLQYMATWFDDTEAELHIHWIRELYRKMKPYVARSPRSAYINYKDLGLGQNDRNCSYEQAKVWGKKYFKGNFERLARIKGRVDPGNFFRNEQSIPVLL